MKNDSAATRSADIIEIDVVPIGDSDVVVLHDLRLAEHDGGERGLTDASGVVWKTATEVVTSTEVLEGGGTVHLLAGVLDAIPPSVGVNIGFKNPGSFDGKFAANLSGDALEAQKNIWRPFTEDVLAIVDDYENDILVSSFYEAALATVRELSDLPVAPLLWDSIKDGNVNVYTVGTWYQAEQLVAAGVDDRIADYPGHLRFGDDSVADLSRAV